MTLLKSSFKPGDWVVYRKTKFTPHPGPRAQDVHPTQGGDDYVYSVDKFWTVAEILEDGQLVLQTRRGKTHTISPEDPLLRKAGFLERLIYRERFPRLDTMTAAS
ncbi:hypothetical protein [Maioricimonas rarisocia]|uniref:hypothetical protein n=1 Tax=Maioricimonas rarisocia TaxID=2528026 RepID=UPI001E394C90|nr:hypothetical protein [Maioricimonas rarisocia]